MVSYLVPKGMEMWGLLHDATEAYLVDIPRPVKAYLKDYNVIEDLCMETIAEKFKLEMPMPDEVLRADNAALKVERERLMIHTNKCMWFIDEEKIVLPWYDGNYMDIYFTPQKPARAEQMFLERYEQLCQKNVSTA
jgi:hypothetical protein